MNKIFLGVLNKDESLDKWKLNLTYLRTEYKIISDKVIKQQNYIEETDKQKLGYSNDIKTSLLKTKSIVSNPFKPEKERKDILRYVQRSTRTYDDDEDIKEEEKEQEQDIYSLQVTPRVTTIEDLNVSVQSIDSERSKESGREGGRQSKREDIKRRYQVKHQYKYVKTDIEYDPIKNIYYKKGKNGNILLRELTKKQFDDLRKKNKKRTLYIDDKNKRTKDKVFVSMSSVL